MFEKVLVLSASAGAGYLRAAQAIERAFTNRGRPDTVTRWGENKRDVEGDAKGG